MKKAFRFGVVTGGRPSGANWVDLARRIEKLGYSSLRFPDGVNTPLAALTALAAAASATTTLRIGSFVLVNDYRHPIQLAREIATLDQISGGRVELGLGAGNWPKDFEQMGIPFDKPGVRVSRFIEGLTIIKQFFASETVNFSGKYYTISELRSTPRPVQQPGPPIMMGPAGSRMLALAAREADIIMPIAFHPSETLEEKINLLRKEAGERFEQIELSQNAFDIELSDGPVPPGPLVWGGIPTTPRSMTTVEAVEHLLAMRERYGFTYISIQERQMENFLPILEHLNGK